MKAIKCPKCKKRVNMFCEIWDGAQIEFTTSEDKYFKPVGHLQTGDPSAVIGNCSNCGHSWKLRGVTQITDLGPNQPQMME